MKPGDLYYLQILLQQRLDPDAEQSFAWADDYSPTASVAATFQILPGTSFVANGASAARDAALTTVSAEVKWRNGFSLAGPFEGEFSNVRRSHAGKGVARCQW